MNISKFDRTKLWERFTEHIDNNENFIFGNVVQNAINIKRAQPTLFKYIYMARTWATKTRVSR